MSIAQPDVLRDVLQQYEHLDAVRHRTPEQQQRMDRLSRALCVAGGTPDLGSALRSVRRHLHVPARG